MKHRLHHLFRGGILAIAPAIMILSGGVSAQTAAPLPSKEVIKARLAAQQQRADQLREEIKATDARLEDRVDDLINTLRMVGDSKDSRTKVARIKEQTVTSLGKSITEYQRKRAWLQGELQRPTYNLTMEEKQRIIARFDEHIEKRVKQILNLNKSMPTHQDYDRYKVVPNDRGWFDGVTYVESEDYKQNQRLATHSNAQRDKVIKGLQASIDRLQRQSGELTQLATSTPAGELHNAYLEEQKKTDAILKTRRTQLSDVFSSPATPTRAVSGKEAQALDNTLKQAVDGLKRDFNNLFERYSNWLKEQSSVNSLKAALGKA